MIYAGLIHFNGASELSFKLSAVLEPYADQSHSLIRKNQLTLCCGKLSSMNDMDEVWKNESSILLGRVFNKVGTPSFNEKSFKQLSHSTKEEVLKEKWGKYIYITHNEKSFEFEIVMDSTGQLPLFFYPFSNGDILFASDVDLIFKVLGEKPVYDWGYLCSYLIYGCSSATLTPFKGVYEIPPACEMKITRGSTQIIPAWDPLSFYKTPYYQKEDAVDILRNSLKPWISPYKNICVSLSGGLDSSSLVYCLKDLIREDQKLVALNYYHSQIKSSNELHHAQKVCEETGIELIGVDSSHSLPFDPFDITSPLCPNKPCPGLLSLKWLTSIFENLPVDGSCTFLSGHGSDHIFMRPPSKRSVSDYILERGLKGVQREINNMTHFYRDSFWAICKENIKSLASHFFSQGFSKRHPKNVQDKIPKWMQTTYKNALQSFAHPIYEHLSSDMPPGKYDQIDAFYEGLASIHMEINPFLATHYPFLYGPVVEFSLSFPTYELFDKGYDRYPLRKAVSDSFQTETVWRRDKSETTGLFQRGIKKNLDYILDICLKGKFAEQGLIDERGLHKTITMLSNGDINHMWPFLHLASAEIFLKCWEDKSS